jgi:hypothetical protein
MNAASGTGQADELWALGSTGSAAAGGAASPPLRAHVQHCSGAWVATKQVAWRTWEAVHNESEEFEGLAVGACGNDGR